MLLSLCQAREAAGTGFKGLVESGAGFGSTDRIFGVGGITAEDAIVPASAKGGEILNKASLEKNGFSLFKRVMLPFALIILYVFFRPVQLVFYRLSELHTFTPNLRNILRFILDQDGQKPIIQQGN